MPPPRPPSYVEPLSFPVFGISWYADPSNGRSITAYCGGGGSARTGVKNMIVIQDGVEEEQRISTEDKTGVALQMYKNPTSNKLWIVVSLEKEVRRYSVPQGELHGVLPMSAGESGEQEESCSTISMNAMADRLAVGCKSGLILIYSTSDGTFAEATPLFQCVNHTAEICALCFSLRGGKILSSAKDGFARVWDATTGDMISEMLCNCDEPNAPPPPPNRPKTIMVRGCAFADMDGKVAISLASGKRGKAYLAQWCQDQDGQPYQCAIRSECSPNPISAMSISQDGRLLALGSADGSIILWSVLDWAVLKVFQSVHAFPVTCIAARPFDVELQGENLTGVQIHAKSASGDCQMGFLTLQRKIVKRKDQSGGRSSSNSLMHAIHHTMVISVLLWLLSPIAREAGNKCGQVYNVRVWDEWLQCVLDNVLLAPSTRPGVEYIPI
jgi:hypothetical protein